MYQWIGVLLKHGVIMFKVQYYRGMYKYLTFFCVYESLFTNRFSISLFSIFDGPYF